ncbi:MAG: leukotriene A4 hydrolase C-terminal domain-containing protein [Bryobacterales bacterium]|nr:leukotriene A4 hydrolase C-terminal domain-containing protein [Bryobacterales bacterium]
MDLGADRLVELDDVFGLTSAGNAEIFCEWLVLYAVNEYAAANGAVEGFLTTVGRRKFLRSLYEQLVKTEDGTVRAKANYRKARPAYHPMAVQTIDRIVAGT